MSLTQGVPAGRVQDLYDVQIFPEVMVPEMYNLEPQVEDMLSPPYSVDDPTDQQNNIDPNSVISALAPQGLTADSTDSSEAPADSGINGTTSCSADSGVAATGDCSGDSGVSGAASGAGDSGGTAGAAGPGSD